MVVRRLAQIHGDRIHDHFRGSGTHCGSGVLNVRFGLLRVRNMPHGGFVNDAGTTLYISDGLWVGI